MAFGYNDISDLLSNSGKALYGQEAINQLEHALQCARLAEFADEPPALIAAALLHDLGHLIAAHREHEMADDHGSDDLHQFLALPFLRPLLPDAVLEPIRMHVDAKRYLCAVDQSYWADLTPASKQSLEFQGGAFSAEEARRFIQTPFAPEAVKLRRYDDLAKVPHALTPPLAHFMGYVEQAGRGQAA